VDIQKNWRPIETAQRFSMTHPKSLQPTLAVTLWRAVTYYLTTSILIVFQKLTRACFFQIALETILQPIQISILNTVEYTQDV
jgi:hypothetical protein